MDIIDAKKNLEIFKRNLQCIDSYNHLYSTFQFEQMLRAQRKDLLDRIFKIEWQLKQARK